MGVLQLLGLIMIAYSIPTAVFFILLFRKAQLVIVLLASAFFWLLAMTLTSLVWAAIPPLQQVKAGAAIVPIGVLLVEAMRYAFIRLYFRSERSFSVVSINAVVFPLVDFWSAVAGGVGFGATLSLVLYAPMIARALGPGTLFSPYCSAFSSLVSAAIHAALFNALHVPLMLLAFDAYRYMHPPRIIALLGLHLGAACLTILNTTNGGCMLSLPLIGLIVLISAGYAAFITHRWDYRSLKARRVQHAE